jgi:hypothetical protein
MLVVGGAFWWMDNFKGNPGCLVTPYLIPAAVGLAAGWLAGQVARRFRDTGHEDLHLALSILATSALVTTYCCWWCRWVAQFARWLEGSGG